MKATKVQLVMTTSDRVVPVEDLPAEMAKMGCAMRRVYANPATREEMQGLGVYDGWCGPMYGGPGIARYETWTAYAKFST